MLYAVKCKKDYPGYEVSHASNREQLIKQIDSWRGCDIDISSIVELGDGEISEEKTKKLAEWTEEFTKTH